MALLNLLDHYFSTVPSQWLHVTAVFLALVLFAHLLQSQNHKGPQKPSISQTPSNPAKPFTTPLPEPLLDFDPATKTPKLYRPFRYGPNHITMGIRKLDWNNWIEMDSYFLRYHDLKASELKKDFDGHVKYVDRPSTKDACFELYEELARYLTHRYPRIFSLKDGVLRNSLAKEEFQYPATWATAKSKGLGINDLHFRSERQTLRRLPRPGAILFTIRTYFEPMTTIAREPHVPGRLAEAIRNWDAVVSAYKGKAHWEGILLPYLDERNAVQVREGVLGGSVEGAFPY